MHTHVILVKTLTPLTLPWDHYTLKTNNDSKTDLTNTKHNHISVGTDRKMQPIITEVSQSIIYSTNESITQHWYILAFRSWKNKYYITLCLAWKSVHLTAVQKIKSSLQMIRFWKKKLLLEQNSAFHFTEIWFK